MNCSLAVATVDERHSPHRFHIPVMGTGFTIDTPLRVAKYGIDSAVSLLDDVLIEQMRKYHSEQNNEPFESIRAGENDARARRITAYLNLMQRLVIKQFEVLKKTAFKPGTEITKYFEMLPDSPLKSRYREMLNISDPVEQQQAQDTLRGEMVPGSIDVNIMTKVDSLTFTGDEPNPAEDTSASSALRGFAMSDLRSSVIFSAGMNPRLYTYAAKFADFLPNASGINVKRIILKVSDFRSALIQGKFLAKLGLWISEFRIESGLNCGGHAFAGKATLMGIVLAEFNRRRSELRDDLFSVYSKALEKLKLPVPDQVPGVRVTAQGGICRSREADFIMKEYNVDSVGWGTPWLLVPEVTRVDDASRKQLQKARRKDIHLSNSSPLGVPFWNLRHSASENARRQRISKKAPGSPCVKGFGRVLTEFPGRPQCAASHEYQTAKLEELRASDLTGRALNDAVQNVLDKSCICHDLAGGATLDLEIDNKATPAICCGPVIAYFRKIATLEEMVDHINGRGNLLGRQVVMHVFNRELFLVIDSLRKDAALLARQRMNIKPKQQLLKLKDQLNAQTASYRETIERSMDSNKARYLRELNSARQALSRIRWPKIKQLLP